ncbi:DUF4365 domain-containing protein [Roseomonas sp. SSH11]|uniref:DUF4365 domain-containing protein n=1 Tax=Pararoseomonas baculiformis TaxID=2820812 RepID=A0ABS4ACC0_9PROT|nr:DUF4365 domain-containing protein [Pararoseomonas baculiformis]MBP0444645.1 DUF4365 domain-containing protein [Pararoseomonas baculiformis]
MISTSIDDIKERLSLAYLTSLAARVGCSVTEVNGPDKASVDALVRPVLGSRNQIDVQLKATSTSSVANGEIFYDLKMINYSHLRAPSTNPHYLMILQLPADETAWIKVTLPELLMRGTLYFGNLQGLPAVPNTSKKRVFIPCSQVMSEHTMQQLIVAAPTIIGSARI